MLLKILINHRLRDRETTSNLLISYWQPKAHRAGSWPKVGQPKGSGPPESGPRPLNAQAEDGISLV